MSKKKAAKTLGVKEDATEAEIKKAYRKASAKAHPDTGGSNEAFQLLQIAYKEMLGEEDYELPNCAATISIVYNSILEQLGDEAVHADFPALLREHFTSNIKSAKSRIIKIEKQIVMFKRLCLCCKNESLLLQINRGRIDELTKLIGVGGRAILDMEAALVYLNDIEYEAEAKPIQEASQYASAFTFQYVSRS